MATLLCMNVMRLQSSDACFHLDLLTGLWKEQGRDQYQDLAAKETGPE